MKELIKALVCLYLVFFKISTAVLQLEALCDKSDVVFLAE